MVAVKRLEVGQLLLSKFGFDLMLFSLLLLFGSVGGSLVLLRRHIGRWQGVQSLHDLSDPERSNVAPSSRKLMGLELLEDPSSEEFIQIGNCLVNQATMKVEKQQARVPIQEVIKKNQPCHNVLVGGPSIVPNSLELTLQICLLSEDQRLKVLVVYEPFDTITIPASSFSIPVSYVVADAVVTREKRVEEFHFTSDALLSDHQTLAALDISAQRQGERWTTTFPQGETTREDIAVMSLKDRRDIAFHIERISLDEGDENNDDDEDEDEDDEEVEMKLSTLINSDILLELPRVLFAGESNSARVTWAANPTKSISAEVLFLAAQNALKPVKRRGGLNEQIDQPIVERFVVEEFKEV